MRSSTSQGLAGSGPAGRAAIQGGAAARVASAIVQCSSSQPTRRAVLYAQATGDPAVSADLASWFTERAFHFYVAGLRLPAAPALTARGARRGLAAAFADLDDACTRLRRADGMASVIVTAQGRGAVAAALWSDSRNAGDDGQLGASSRAGSRAAAGAVSDQCRADALILSAPAWPKGSLRLHIACPGARHRGPGCRPVWIQGMAPPAAPCRRASAAARQPCDMAGAGRRGRGPAAVPARARPVAWRVHVRAGARPAAVTSRPAGAGQGAVS